MFEGNLQHDCHELLLCMLAYVQDAVKEINTFRSKFTFSDEEIQMHIATTPIKSLLSSPVKGLLASPGKGLCSPDKGEGAVVAVKRDLGPELASEMELEYDECEQILPIPNKMNSHATKANGVKISETEKSPLLTGMLGNTPSKVVVIGRNTPNKLDLHPKVLMGYKTPEKAVPSGSTASPMTPKQFYSRTPDRAQHNEGNNQANGPIVNGFSKGDNLDTMYLSTSKVGISAEEARIIILANGQGDDTTPTKDKGSRRGAKKRRLSDDDSGTRRRSARSRSACRKGKDTVSPKKENGIINDKSGDHLTNGKATKMSLNQPSILSMFTKRPVKRYGVTGNIVPCKKEGYVTPTKLNGQCNGLHIESTGNVSSPGVNSDKENDNPYVSIDEEISFCCKDKAKEATAVVTNCDKTKVPSGGDAMVVPHIGDANVAPSLSDPKITNALPTPILTMDFLGKKKQTARKTLGMRVGLSRPKCSIKSVMENLDTEEEEVSPNIKEEQLKEGALKQGSTAVVKLCITDIPNYVIHKKLEIARTVVKHKKHVSQQFSTLIQSMSNTS